MKKISVVSFNLRFLRLPLVLLMFALCTGVSVSLCNAPIPLDMGEKAVHSIIRSNTVFLKSSQNGYVGVFSLLNTSEIGKDTTPAEKLSAPVSQTAKAPPEKNVLSRTVQNASEVKISNSTNQQINVNDFLASEPKFLKENFSVLILHTHTTESYTPSEKYSYTPSDTDRTRDKSYNMVRVGDEIEKILTERGIKVYHDSTINDYPSYNGSYNRSSANAAAYIKNDPSIKIVLDVHRDAVESTNGEKVKYICEIDGKDAACIMFVVGSNISGLEHNNWKENMSFAVQLQRHIASIYPSLCRPLNFRSQRFNQQLAPGALIVEVGTNGNTLDEALLGARYFAQGLADFISENQ